MPANALLKRLATIYAGENIRHPQLRAVTLAQWLLESGRATSDLARLHLNFGGLKWRPEMAGFATRVEYEASDGVDFYCKFATIESFINGYWRFINRPPYSGWEGHVSTPEDYIGFIGPIYTPTPGYAAKVLNLVPEAEALLAVGEASAETETGGVTRLGTIVIDPGHGGTVDLPGSSQNNAMSFSGVKEKKLTLDFCLILRDQLLSQARRAREDIKVVMTRTTDVNLSGAARAGLALQHRARLFLCLHFNGSQNRDTRGSETFFRAAENGNINLAEDIAFATAINTAMFTALKEIDPQATDRGVKPDTQTGPGALGVLNDERLGNTQRPPTDQCRAAYVEMEFITNRRVDRLLISGPDAIANRTRVMSAIAKAIRKHMKEMG